TAYHYRRAALILTVLCLQHKEVERAGSLFNRLFPVWTSEKVMLLAISLHVLQGALDNSFQQLERITTTSPRIHYMQGSLYLLRAARIHDKAQVTHNYAQAVKHLQQAVQARQYSLPAIGELVAQCAAFILAPEQQAGVYADMWQRSKPP